MKWYLPYLILAIGFWAGGVERLVGLGRRHGRLASSAKGDPVGAGSCALRLPFLDEISSYGIKRTMRAQDGQVGRCGPRAERPSRLANSAGPYHVNREWAGPAVSEEKGESGPWLVFILSTPFHFAGHSN
jgi:hypothetical protein